MAWRRGGTAQVTEPDAIVLQSRETKALLDHLTGRLGNFTDRLEDIAAAEEARQQERERNGGS